MDVGFAILVSLAVGGIVGFFIGKRAAEKKLGVAPGKNPGKGRRLPDDKDDTTISPS